MEPRLREVNKGRAAKITKHMKLGHSANSKAGFLYTVSKFVELAVISCSGTRFESDEGGPFANLIGRFSLYGQ
jgi:hypothetical protein